MEQISKKQKTKEIVELEQNEEEEEEDEEEIEQQDIKEARKNQFTIEDMEKMEKMSLFNSAIKRYRRLIPQLDKKLYSHQIEGLGWMLDREQYFEENEQITQSSYESIRIEMPEVDTIRQNDRIKNTVLGGILADEMGLGKTAQMIALIKTNLGKDKNNKFTLERKNFTGPTLVVVPAPKGVLFSKKYPGSLLNNWINEINQWWPKAKVYLYYGDPKIRKEFNKFNNYDIILTVYETLRDDLQDREIVSNINWWRIILDEAHKIVNPESKAAEEISFIKGKYRWLITGTPFQNKWRDFFSLLKFLHVIPYGFFQVWYRLIENPLTDKDKIHKRDDAFNLLTNLIDVLVLRRTKNTKYDNTNLVLDTTTKILRKNNIETIKQLNFDTFEVGEKKGLIPYIIKERPTFTFLSTLIDLPPKTITYEKIKLSKNERENYNKVWNATNYKALEHIIRLKSIIISPLIEKAKKTTEVEMREIIREGIKEEAKREPTKIMECIRIIQENTEKKTKTILFSTRIPTLFIIQGILEMYQNKDKFIWKFGNNSRKYDKNYSQGAVMYGATTQNTRKRYQELLNDPNSKMKLLLTTYVAGEGLTLTGASNVIFIDLPWNPSKIAQAIDRVHRIGQTKPVNVTILVAQDTIEEVIAKLLGDKKRISEQSLLQLSIPPTEVLPQPKKK